jgi:F-type H+-transporting ATPase subunit b
VLESLGIDWRFILISAIGFLILVFVLRKFAFGPILGMLQQRQDYIRGNLNEAEERRNEMVRLQQDYEQRLAQIEDEARDKIQAAVKEAQAARDEIVNRARTESETIVQRAHQEVERERAKAMVEMRNQIAELAIQAAGQVVKQTLDSRSHARLIDDVIAGVGRNGNTNQPGKPAGGAA